MYIYLSCHQPIDSVDYVQPVIQNVHRFLVGSCYVQGVILPSVEQAVESVPAKLAVPASI